MSLIRDLTDEEARTALPQKWGSVEPGVIPAYIAEMDFAPAPVVRDAVVEAVRRGVTGYPPPGDGGGRDGVASWTGWRASVEQIEAESGMRHRFLRGRRGIGNRGAHDRLLSQEIAHRLTRPRPSFPAGVASTAGQSTSGQPSSCP